MCHQMHTQSGDFFCRIVVACSYALIHAVMRAFCYMRLLDCLRAMFNFVIKKYTTRDISSIIYLTLCRNHFLWVLVLMLSRKKLARKVLCANFCLEALCARLQAKDFEEFSVIYTTVTLSQKTSTKATEACEMVLGRASTFKVEEPSEMYKIIEVDENVFGSDTKLLDSPFYTNCLR